MTDLTVKKSHNTLVSEDTKKGRLNPLVLLEGEDKMEVVPKDSWPNAVEGGVTLPWGEQEVREGSEEDDEGSEGGDPTIEEEDDGFEEVISRKTHHKLSQEEKKHQAEKAARKKRAEEYQARLLLHGDVEAEVMNAFITILTIGLCGADTWCKMNQDVEAVGSHLYQKKQCARGDVFVVDPACKAEIMQTLRKQGHLAVDPKHLYELTAGKQTLAKAE